MTATRDSLLMALNFIAFQVGWFACVLGATRGWPLLRVAKRLDARGPDG